MTFVGRGYAAAAEWVSESGDNGRGGGGDGGTTSAGEAYAKRR